jgi:hypothetical protein
MQIDLQTVVITKKRKIQLLLQFLKLEEVRMNDQELSLQSREHKWAGLETEKAEFLVNERLLGSYSKLEGYPNRVGELPRRQILHIFLL